MEHCKLTTSRIAEIVGGTLVGDGSLEIRSVAALERAGEGEITFASDQTWFGQLSKTGASAAIVPETFDPDGRIAYIRVADVTRALVALLGHLADPDLLPAPGIHPTAIVAEGASVGEGVRIGPWVTVGEGSAIGEGTVLMEHVSIGPNVRVGRDCLLYEGVRVRRGCEIGDRVKIGCNSVVGFEGFGYYFAEGEHHHVPHAGNVVIEDDVEIGACACVDRAKFGSTRISVGTKIDNLVQVAHNVQIGRGCLVAGMCGIAGSARLGEYVVLGGHVGVRDNVEIGKGARVAAFTAVWTSLPPGVTVFGVPAGPQKEKFREVLYIQKLPELVRQVKELEKRLNSLESSEDN
jgi:UDP-3-O-[3-hydroxymyristoyl] glucosamine N-acyltransferase